MAMKKSKKNLSDRVNVKTTTKRLNPFEVHINRQKYDVLGKKSKTEKGLPGVSRARAIKKRKETLLQEYKLKSKVNQFVDRRIGEHNASMTKDDKLLARFTSERMKFHSRNSLYNLGDNEVLTHRGESLADIEKFEDPKSDEDDDDDYDGKNRGGKLDQDFVSEAHFGGGMLRRVDGDSKSRKDLIDHMIADSKRRKAEKQKLREQTLDLTEKLDTEWKDVLPLVASSKKARFNDDVTLKSDRKYASYDILSKELIFEARGRATDKLKPEAEIAREEKEKLDQLERERLERMTGDVTENKGVKHRSADDLDDGFDFNDAFLKPKKKNKNDESSDDSDIEEPPKQMNASSASESAHDEEDSDDENNQDVNAEVELKSESENDDDDDDDDDEGDSSDDLSDLKNTDDDSEEEDLTSHKDQKSTTSLSKKNITKNKNVTEDVKVVEEDEEDEKLKNSLKYLPFTLSVPESYSEFETMVADKGPEYSAVVVERMVKSNHPSLPEGSRQKLVTLFTYCLQYLQDVTSNLHTMESSFRVLNCLAPWLYDLTQFAPAMAISALCDVIKEKYEDFLKKPRQFPSLDTLVFFKLIGILFPTSDYRHRIVTPTLVFMQHILSSCRIHTSSDVATGLFVATLVLEFTALSKRFTPEAINFLYGILRSSQSAESSFPTVPPFKAKSSFPLHVSPNDLSTTKQLLPLGAMDLIDDTISDEFKLRAINLALQLLDGFCINFDKSSEYLIVEPFVSLLQAKNYCDCLKESVQSLLERIMVLKKKKLYKLITAKERPKPLKLYEPKIEDVYTFKKKRTMTKEKEDHEKLVYKYKKEVKGALREIRRDNAFLSKLKFNETKASDIERRRKVKEIFGDAAQQAGDLNKLKRGK